jgi:hypothetical protein
MNVSLFGKSIAKTEEDIKVSEEALAEQSDILR